MLARLYHELTRAEGSREPMRFSSIETQFRAWFDEGCRALIFQNSSSKTLAYCLYKEMTDCVFLKHFFVALPFRRQGVGTRGMQQLLEAIWPQNKKVYVEVLADNPAAKAFWEKQGFAEFSHTMRRLPGQR